MSTPISIPGVAGGPRPGAGGAIATGTGPLVRLILRRDRVALPLWLLAVGGFVAATVATIGDLLPTLADRRSYAAEIAANPAVLLMQGPAYDASIGAIAAQQRAAATTIFAALGSVLFLIRHTRADEQAGRRELLGATPIGRHAPLTAALTVVLGANAVLAVLITVLLGGMGMPLDGSLAWGLVAGCAGALGAAMAAVAAQLVTGARAAALGSLGVFFGMYLIRGIGDLAAPGLSWLGWVVPNGWLLRARPFGEERWWVFAALAALTVLLIAGAYRLSARRDLGAGLVPERRGPAGAGAALGSPLGLGWRLQRTTILAWTAGVTAFALAVGVGARGAIDRFGRSEALATWATRMGGGDPGEVFFGLVVYMCGAYTITLFALLSVARLRQEEGGGAAETLLSGPVARLRWAGAHLAYAFAVPALLLTIAGLVCGIGAGDVAGLLKMTLTLLPAVWVVTGLAVAAYGLFGRAGLPIAWAMFALLVLVEFGWEIGLVGDGLFRVSPFAHVHYSALADPGPLTLAALTLVAAGLTTAGLMALRRRDLAL